MKLPLCVTIFVCWIGVARAEISMEGYMTTAQSQLFVLSVDKKETSGWLPIGGVFDGFILQAFDRKTVQLTITKNGDEWVLRLAPGKVRALPNQPDVAATKPILVLLPGGESIAFGDDSAMDADLKLKLGEVAGKSPQASVTLRFPQDAAPDIIRRVFDLVRSAGITHVSIATAQEPIQSSANNGS